MYCSSIFIFSLVVLINLSSGATNGDFTDRYPDNNNYEMPRRNKRQEETLNIGNGVNRHNVVSLSPNPGSQPDMGYRFGGDTQNAQQPNPGQQRSVSNIGNGSQNRNTVSVNSGGRNPQSQSGAPNPRNNGRRSFVAPIENRRFNVGYGQDNQNTVIVNGQRIQPAAPVSSDGRTYRTQGNTGNARNNYGNGGNITPVYLNGKVLQPDLIDGNYSTYYINGQMIQVLNSGSQQPTDRHTQLKTLYALSAQIQQITSKLNYEAARLNIKM